MQSSHNLDDFDTNDLQSWIIHFYFHRESGAKLNNEIVNTIAHVSQGPVDVQQTNEDTGEMT